MRMEVLTMEEIAMAAVATDDALRSAEKVLREAIEDYEGLNLDVWATRKNEFGQALDKIRAALDLPPYVTRAEREAEASAAAQRWGEE